eukprot:CAMPEP_0114560698 /NCGR_PEP_ID=MMETSP0114-20121206/11596_1 /TAXON_ID=31324 /ORGANISM="Goniomonas sp, Strain m" /LENGTH=365 /DNA_ID=CAMNT_0001746257 /DNA_START=81 /DNA_END=1178 /DNA_ORIENTATION=+
MYVFFYSQADHLISLDLHPDTTVAAVKAQASQKTGLAANLQHLVFVGQTLEDHRTLGSYNIREGSVIDMQFATPLRVHTPIGAKPMSRSRDGPSLYVFDLDDTLTRNGVMTQTTRDCLRELRDAGARMAIASFNACAVEILQENGVESYFDVIVCGWSPVVRKTEHIAKIVSVLGWEQSFDGPRLYFFDDLLENVSDVRQVYNLSYCVRVYSVEVLPMLISHCRQLDSQRILPAAAATSPPATTSGNAYTSPYASPLKASPPPATLSSLLSAASTPAASTRVVTPPRYRPASTSSYSASPYRSPYSSPSTYTSQYTPASSSTPYTPSSTSAYSMGVSSLRPPVLGSGSATAVANAASSERSLFVR